MNQPRYVCEETLHHVQKMFKHACLSAVGLLDKNQTPIEVSGGAPTFYEDFHKIDYRASFGPYVGRETFDTFDLYQKYIDSGEAADAEPQITHFSRTLGNDNRRATEHLILATDNDQERMPSWLVSWKMGDGMNWLSITDTEGRLDKPIETIQWNERAFKRAFDKDKQALFISPNIAIKCLLRNPLTQECIGSYNLSFVILNAQNSDKLMVNVVKLLKALRANSNILRLLASTYAEVREYRRLAIQHLNLTKVSDNLFQQESQDIAQSYYRNAQEPEPAKTDDNYPGSNRFLPRIIDATQTILKFLGQYTQARHILLIEVHKNCQLDIFQTWSCKSQVKDETASQDPYLAPETRQLEKETETLINLKKELFEELSSPSENIASEIQRFIDVQVLDALFDSEKAKCHQLNAEHSNQVVLPEGLTTRRPIHLLSSEQVFSDNLPNVDWYIVIIDRVDTTVDKGKMHNWQHCTHMSDNITEHNVPGNTVDKPITIIKDKFKHYLRSYKDQCKQHVWSNEAHISKGKDFGESSQQWLNWVKKFIQNRVNASQISFVHSDIYQRHGQFETAVVNILSFSEFLRSFSGHATRKKVKQNNEEDWDNILRLMSPVLIPESTFLSHMYMPISEEPRHELQDSINESVYTSSWRLNISHKTEKYSYMHIFLFQTVCRQIARVRALSLREQFDQDLASYLGSTDNLLVQYDKLVTHSTLRADKRTSHSSLAHKIVYVIQECFVKPYIGINTPVLLLARDSSTAIIHNAMNQKAVKQLNLPPETAHEICALTLDKVLKDLNQTSQIEYSPSEQPIIKTEDKRSATGRYTLVSQFSLQDKRLLEGVLLVFGRNNQPFTTWMSYCLARIASAITPLLSLSTLNYQVNSAMGVFRHSIVGPLQGIMSAAKTSQKLLSKLDVTNQPSIERATGRLQSVINTLQANSNSLLAWRESSKSISEAPKPNLDIARNLCTDFESWVSNFDGLAKEHGLVIERTIPFKLIELRFDHYMIEVAVANLLDNAIKYTVDHDVITASLKVNGPYIEIAITNRGPYISEVEKERIMAFGQRSFSLLESIVHGQGIGLPLASSFVRAHPLGSITIYSEPFNRHANNTFMIRFRDMYNEKLKTQYKNNEVNDAEYTLG